MKAISKIFGLLLLVVMLFQASVKTVHADEKWKHLESSERKSLAVTSNSIVFIDSSAIDIQSKTVHHVSANCESKQSIVPVFNRGNLLTKQLCTKEQSSILNCFPVFSTYLYKQIEQTEKHYTKPRNTYVFKFFSLPKKRIGKYYNISNFHSIPLLCIC